MKNKYIQQKIEVLDKIYADGFCDALEEIKDDVLQIIDYLYEDEKRHYEEKRSKNHIFLTLKKLRKELNYE